jgi:hypothetical protein
VLALEPGEEGAWKGTGSIVTTGILTDRSRLGASAGGAAAHLGSILGSVLEGATLTAATPLKVEAGSEEFRFEFSLPPVEKNSFGEMVLVLGQPAAGLMGALPGDVNPGAVRRESPVILGHGLQQRLEVSIRGSALASLPAPQRMEAGCGSFSLELDESHGWTTISRDLVLNGGRIEAEQWPTLRALLLEEQDPRHGTIILE